MADDDEAQLMELKDMLEAQELKIEQLQQLNEELQRQRDRAFGKIADLEEQLQAAASAAVSAAPAKGVTACGNGAQVDPEEEVFQLRAIVEAQEAALVEQRQIIDSQSALISDLSVHLQPQLQQQAAPLASSRSATPSRGPMPVEAEQPILSSNAAAGRGPGRGAGQVNAAAGRNVPSVTRTGGAAVAQRSPRIEQQLLAQKRIARAGGAESQAQRPRAELPRPRPNSAFRNREGGVARSRSLTTDKDERGSTGGSTGESAHTPAGSRHSPSTTALPRKVASGDRGMLPPSLPLLRQEA
mmetsp:Transcript_44952/g.106747  ORF Transcript_44952/g.106747 Transcript_44952/m.106747 type:complete len:299 (+) Transcript_44952:95-991(+)